MSASRHLLHRLYVHCLGILVVRCWCLVGILSGFVRDITRVSPMITVFTCVSTVDVIAVANHGLTLSAHNELAIATDVPFHRCG